VERFSLRKLNEIRGKEQFCVEISNRFAALEDLDTEVGINSVWGNYYRKHYNFSQRESRLL
jgi:hypothetical protein